MDEEELRSWLALWRTPGVGARGFVRLLERFGKPAAVLAAQHGELSGMGLRERALAALSNPDWTAVDLDMKWALESSCHIVTMGHEAYPPLLRDLIDPPPVLYVRGNVETLSMPQLAVVGSRKPSSGGMETAKSFCKSLARSGLTITSGLALGIDSAAHRGALAGGGSTIAVVGTGPDKCYPARHRELADAVADQGAVVTEYPVGTPVMSNNFPRRNRIISGMSVGTLVVEAAVRSGSLITARLAMEQSREVFAVPGSIHHPMARGCNGLIKQGAKLIETAGDIVEELGALLGTFEVANNEALKPLVEFADTLAVQGLAQDPEYGTLLDALAYEPLSIDVLVDRTGLTAEQLSSMLLLLELQGQVESAPGGCYSKSP